MQKKFAPYSLTVLTLVFAACGGSHSKPILEYMPHMMDSPAVKAQEGTPRLPVAGTMPIGFTPYRYTKDQGALAGEQLNNPLPRTREVMLRGQKMYNTDCIVCHGQRGLGDGSVVPKFPRPPSLHSDKVRGWKDGQLFHTITMGQNLMPSYASQLDVEDRWAIVHYIRALQRAEHPLPSDITLLESELKNLNQNK